MVAYEFYVRDNFRGDRLIGILPERRRRPDRITEESIFRWASKVFSTMVDLTKVYFVSVTVQRNGRGFYFPEPCQGIPRVRASVTQPYPNAEK